MLCLANKSHAAALTRYVEGFEATRICGLAFYETASDASAYLQWMEDWHHNQHMPDGIVGSSLYVWMEDGEILGVVMLRHALNAFLERIGGHIGYSVAPAYRQQGIAKAMVQEVLAIAKKQFHMERCLISCTSENVASRATIVSCGGRLLRQEAHEGNTYEMYEIGGYVYD